MERDSIVTSGQVHQAVSCDACRKAREAEEMAFAFLLALMPVITLTLFGNMGLL
ncbi:MAG: hypothetical protein HGA38_05385 [Candidatus Moranbacteria bacterium]|nr:hypothetical protein [Candidatus Moranbacteria bacterium]